MDGPVLTLGRRMIGGGHPTYFIADIASNHDGDLDRAVALIRAASDAGADAVKFQHFLADEIVSDAGFATLGKRGHQASWGASVYETFKKYELNREWTPILADVAQDEGVDFISTPYDLDAVKHLAPFVPAYKIGSGDIDYYQLLEAVALEEKPILLATGASGIMDVVRAVASIYGTGFSQGLAVMQCNTNYTGNLRNVEHTNLRVLETYKKFFPDCVLGLSDHTPGHTTVLGAVAMGARVIEKHFTDDNDRSGPDHAFSMTPRTWEKMVLETHRLEAALGDGIKRIEANERETVAMQRRGYYGTKRLRPNLKLLEESLESLPAGD